MKLKKQLSYIQKSGDTTSIKRIERIILELSRTPFKGVGKPEALKHELKGCWSRRVNKKDRIVYSVNEAMQTVTIITSKGHYSDK